jgi:hypothetical protein
VLTVGLPVGEAPAIRRREALQAPLDWMDRFAAAHVT